MPLDGLVALLWNMPTVRRSIWPGRFEMICPSETLIIGGFGDKILMHVQKEVLTHLTLWLV